MLEGYVTAWFKEEGDHVEEGEPLVEVEAEKATSVIEAPATGVLTSIVAKVEEVVPIRGVLGVITT
jgi:pyruvate/2-oxoglutarate dehydrogenase complex dihydrolipoamide acyltransferase (E2) component